MYCETCGSAIPEGGTCPSCSATAARSPGADGGPPRTSGFAVWALILGILVLFSCGLTALPALILGIVALSQIGGSRGRITGSGMAVAGIVLACLAIPMIGIQAGLLLPALASARERARRTKCMSNLKQIGYGCHLFSGDNNERFPASLGELYPSYIPDGQVFVCPTALTARPITRADIPPDAPDAGKYMTDANTDYAYVSGLKSTAPPDLVLAYDKDGNHLDAGRSVLFVGANVEWMTESAFQAAMERTRRFLETGRAPPPPAGETGLF